MSSILFFKSSRYTSKMTCAYFNEVFPKACRWAAIHVLFQVLM